jgi:hypothetical protein
VESARLVLTTADGNGSLTRSLPTSPTMGDCDTRIHHHWPACNWKTVRVWTGRRIRRSSDAGANSMVTNEGSRWTSGGSRNLWRTGRRQALTNAIQNALSLLPGGLAVVRQSAGFGTFVDIDSSVVCRLDAHVIDTGCHNSLAIGTERCAPRPSAEHRWTASGPWVYAPV